MCGSVGGEKMTKMAKSIKCPLCENYFSKYDWLKDDGTCDLSEFKRVKKRISLCFHGWMLKIKRVWEIDGVVYKSKKKAEKFAEKNEEVVFVTFIPTEEEKTKK